VLLQEGIVASRKHPRCQVTKENEAKKKNSMMWGGWYKMDTQAIFPPPQWRVYLMSQCEVVKRGGFRKTHYLDEETKPSS
jgi:hypothetical protein